MSRKTSAFVSGFSIATAVFQALANAVIDVGGSDEDLRRIEKDEVLRRKLAEMIVKKKVPAPLTPLTFLITIDYSLSLIQMIKLGHYDWVDSDITEKKFPFEGSGKKEAEIVLVHLNKVASTDEVFRELDRRNLRPAKIEELLAFAAKFPEEQRKYPVVALGAVWQDSSGSHYCLYLYESASERSLHLRWLPGDWVDYARFASLSK